MYYTLVSYKKVKVQVKFILEQAMKAQRGVEA